MAILTVTLVIDVIMLLRYFGHAPLEDISLVIDWCYGASELRRAPVRKSVTCGRHALAAADQSSAGTHPKFQIPLPNAGGVL